MPLPVNFAWPRRVVEISHTWHLCPISPAAPQISFNPSWGLQSSWSVYSFRFSSMCLLLIECESKMHWSHLNLHGLHKYLGGVVWMQQRSITNPFPSLLMFHSSKCGLDACPGNRGLNYTEQVAWVLKKMPWRTDIAYFKRLRAFSKISIPHVVQLVNKVHNWSYSIPDQYETWRNHVQSR